MVLRSVSVFIFVLAAIAGFSQDSTAVTTTTTTPVTPKKKTFRPDIPGSFIVELGINIKNGITPPDFQHGFWGSRTMNFYYQYPIRLFKSNFSINPGIGLSLERWKL